MHLDDQQKQYVREALQHMKNGLDKLRQFEAEAGAEVKTSVTNGITQVESGLRTALGGISADGSFDPANELRGAYGNTYDATHQRVAGQSGATGNEFPDSGEKPTTQTQTQAQGQAQPTATETPASETAEQSSTAPSDTETQGALEVE